MFNEFPERVLADLPETIRNKISSDIELDSSDCRVARSYLEKTIMHLENTCSTEGEARVLARFYMTIGARVPETTIEYFAAHVRDELLLEDLKAYENVTSDIKINMNSSPIRNQSFLSVCHINSDKGFRRWNLYAENYGKLVKSIKRWTETEASHLRLNCEYSVHIDEFHVGKVTTGRKFVPNAASDMYGFIFKFFEPPIRITLNFSLTESNESNLANCFSFECKVKEEKKHSSILILPINPDMKYGLISKNIVDVSRKILDLTRFQEAMSCDIEGTILLNSVEIAAVDIDSGEPRITEAGESHLKAECGVLPIEDDDSPKMPDQMLKMSLWQRIKFVFLG